MNRRFYNNKSERGVALVITLIMLAIVTVMAIIFLAVTRRERQAVKASEDQFTAKMMMEAALERAKAQAIANMVTAGSKNAYDLFNSRAFINANGFDPGKGGFDPRNVSYVYRNGTPLSTDDLLRMLSNLQYDPLVPVFVPTNNAGDREFRFYLDFNRNRVFETNGFLSNIDTNGVAMDGATNRFVGDPEWIGVLERPELPHSETNRFIGRYAFLALPAGKTLDLNFMHNQVMPQSTDDLRNNTSNNGFRRNQGYGSWEINLAAFLRELNTNNYAWPSNSYELLTNPTSLARGDAFDDARALLDFRYDGRRSNLLPAILFTNEFGIDGIDNYGDGPFENALFSVAEDDNLQRPWPGSTNILAFTDVQELFTLGSRQFSSGFADFTTRLETPGRQRASYDRYMVYRMLSQLGVDSAVDLKGKVHLNYENTPGNLTNNIIPWTNAVAFFTNAADAMLKATLDRRIYPTNIAGTTYLLTNYFIGDTIVRPDISVTNILLWASPVTNNPYAPSNEYTATIHRLLQVAVNIYDSMTNRPMAQAPGAPYYPTVMRPIFAKTVTPLSTNVLITGFEEVSTNASFFTTQTLWYDLQDLATNSLYRPGVYTNIILYGHPLIIGAKKGHPAFNELSLESFAQMTRKVEVRKPAEGATSGFTTNQMFLMSVNNIWGVEAWNSYTNDYRRNIMVVGDVTYQAALTNVFNGLTNQLAFQSNRFVMFRRPTNFWSGTTIASDPNPLSFEIPLYTNKALVDDAAFDALGLRLLPQNQAAFQALYDPPQVTMWITNRLRYWIIDVSANRLVDFVNLDKLVTVMDISAMMRPSRNDTNMWAGGQINESFFWATNRVVAGIAGATEGIVNQIKASLGELSFNPEDPVANENLYTSFWRDYNQQYNTDRKYGIDRFRKFLGLAPIYHREPFPEPPGLTQQTPFVPTRKFYQRVSWQVNDPLVRFNESDLRMVALTQAARPPNVSSADISAQNSNLGRINEAYNPWGGGPVQGAVNNTNAYRTHIKDPGIRSSDDWVFPVDLTTNNFIRFPNIGWLGRVHRGTPWQTIYLKASAETDVGWFRWAGRLGTHPVQDRRLLEVFTVAPNENAIRGLLSVNQTNQAAWSAVLSGIPVITFADPRYSRSRPITYTQELIEPGGTNIAYIVKTINEYRSLLVKPVYTVTNGTIQTNFVRTGFQHLGDILGAPGLSDQSPYVLKNFTTNHLNFGMRDEMAERLPQTILSLLKKDEPRFVVYAYGQSLKPAPGAMNTTANYYGLVTNYQITGEVITKTTFRVEGELDDPSKPLRAVVESYKVLPPPE